MKTKVIDDINEFKNLDIYNVIKQDMNDFDFYDDLIKLVLINNQDYDETEINFSIIISTHNRDSIIIRTLYGIFAQTYYKFEIIIVDDSDNDKTKELLNKINSKRIKYFHVKQNYGGGYSKKIGYSKAKGDIIIFSDDDDYYIDNKYFEKLYKKFQLDNYSMIVSNTLSFNETERKYYTNNINVQDGIQNDEYLTYFQYELDKPTSMFPMALNAKKIKECHYEELKFFGDTSLYLYGLLAEGKIGVIKDYIGVYRIQGNSVTGNSKADFIVENFESKYDIFIKAINKNLIKMDKNKWLYRQIMSNVDFHFSSKRNTLVEDNKIIRWCLKYIRGKYKFILFAKIIKYRFFKINKRSK